MSTVKSSGPLEEETSQNAAQPVEQAKAPVESTTSAAPTKAEKPQLEDEAYTLIGPRKTAKKVIAIDEDEPLIDTTEAIPLKSKKTERMQKRLERKLKKTTVVSETKSFLELPPELLQEVLSYLRPNDVVRLLRLNKSTRHFILENENLIAKDIITRRYDVLSRSFYLPVPLSQVPDSAQAALQTRTWQDRLKIHVKSYGYIQPINSSKLCTCLSCALAWNNLNLILDLSFHQKNLDDRQPIPMIPRGTHPKWNTDLMLRNSTRVSAAIDSPIFYAAILQIHLNTIVSTLTRQVRVGKKTCHPNRLFHLSTRDIEKGTDKFLGRSGPPSYEFPVTRDNYYSLEAYVPNRKWHTEDHCWQYAKPGQPHENDLAWLMARFQPPSKEEEMERLANEFKQKVKVWT